VKKVNFSLYKKNKNVSNFNARYILWLIVNILFFKTSVYISSKAKVYILKKFGASIGKRVVIKNSVNIKQPWLLKIGDNCWIGENVWIDNIAWVVIGKNVCLSQGAYLFTGNHDYKKQSFDLITGKISIEDGVWIGAHAIVCPSVTCRTHSILAVASVATHNLDEYGIYQGNPAIKKRRRIIV
jgi:putative colanic acid biosynthesis acetyltransferase WcaF